MFRSAFLLSGFLLALPLVAQPRLTKNFDPAVMNLNGTTQLRFVITNTAGDPAQTGMRFSDTLQPGLELVTLTGGNCKADNILISGDKRTLILVNGRFDAGVLGGPGDHSCFITVQVRAATCRTFFPFPAFR